MLKRFLQRTDGSVTVEFAVWMPFIFCLLAFCVDTSKLMHYQSPFYEAGRSASRQVALGIMTPAEAQTAVRAKFPDMELTVSIDVADGFATAVIGAPMEQVAQFIGNFRSGSIAASVSMWVESNDV